MNEFKKVIQDLIEVFRQLTGIEQAKLNAAAGKHVATVEDCITKEQALVLKLRGLERERERRQEAAGYGGMQFRQILETVSEEERAELLPAFHELSAVIQLFQSINDDANRILKTNLHEIEKALNQKIGEPYDDQGKPEVRSRHLTSRKA